MCKVFPFTHRGFLISSIFHSSLSLMLTINICLLLGWPKSSFEYFRTSYRKTQIFWPTQYFIDNETEAQWGCLTCLGLQSYIVMELGSNPGVILQVSGSQQGVVLFPRYYLSMSGDVFCCHNWREGADGI